ncbi:Fluoroquinolones export permease protein/MT2760 [compost metagenome]
MSRIIFPVWGDLKQIYRDPMLIICLAGPLALVLALRFGVPAVSDLLLHNLGFELSPYYELIMSFALLLVPLILGCMAGFMILDERDENMIQYFAVTPLTKNGYLAYRLGFVVILTVIDSLLLFAFSGLTPLRLGNTLLLMPMLALEAPVFALFLTAFASNKIEGLALSKGASILVLTPLIVFFVHSPWQYLGGIIPCFWPVRTFLSGSSFSLAWCTLPAAAGTAVHVVFLRYLVQRFLRRAD